MGTLNSGNAQFTALPTFNQGLFGNAFAATSVDAGWGAPSFTPGKEPDPAAPTVPNPNAEWSASNQKPVGAPTGANGNGKADAGKGGDKQNRKSRGGKGRNGKDNKGTKDNNNAKGGKGKGGESDQNQSKTHRSGNKQNRTGKNQANNAGSKSDKAAPVDAVIPAKSGNRRGGHHANKKSNDGKTSSDKN